MDRASLDAARRSEDVLGAHRLVLDAYATDTKPLCAEVREDIGAPAEPTVESGYAERVAQERLEGAGAGWG